MAGAFALADSTCLEYEERIMSLRQRISNCLNEAIAKRRALEAKLADAKRRQEQLASAGGDTALSLVTYAASMTIMPEIIALEASVAAALLEEHNIRKIYDDFVNAVEPLHAEMHSLQEHLCTMSVLSGNHLANLAVALRQIRSETSGADLSQVNYTTHIDLNYSSGNRVVVDSANGNALATVATLGKAVVGVSAGTVATKAGLTTKDADGHMSVSMPMMQLFSRPEVNMCGLETTSRVLPDGSVLKTTGLASPFVESLNARQGYNSLGYPGTCSLATISNWNKALGRNVTEDEVVHVAVALDCCKHDCVGSAADGNGGARDDQILRLLNEVYSIPSSARMNTQVSVEQLARYIESGHLVMAGIDSGALWKNRPSGKADHEVSILSGVMTFRLSPRRTHNTI